MSDFSTAEKVAATIRASDDVESRRGQNRVLINQAANNDPLIPEDEAERLGMKIFNRWGEFMITLANAARQFLTNFTSQDTYFTISVPRAPEEIRADLGGDITQLINAAMKDGDRQMDYFLIHLSKWKAIVAHGIAPMLWEDRYGWLPRFIAIEDLRIPTDVEISFRNLTWFAVRIAYTPGELSRKAFSKVESKWKWDRNAVVSLLKNVEQCNTTMAENNYNWESEPEKFEELRKQNAGYWSGDAMPTINLMHFFHQDENKKWWLKIVPDNNSTSTILDNDSNFVCQSSGPVADHWNEILHVNFGDLNNKAPLLYHSVRSLGFALFDPCYWTDFTRCRLLQHTLDQFNILLRVTDPVDKARAAVQVFQNLGVVKPGVTFIPNNERWQVDTNLVEGMMAQTKQLQGEFSTAYTQSVDNGTQREQTAFETGVKVQQNNAMLSGIMLLAKAFEKTAAQEICRRFCLENSDDPDVIEFQKSYKQLGYPVEFLDSKKWKVEINLPLGAGNPTMAMVEAQNMLQLRALADPSAQQKMAHDAAVQMIGTSRAREFFSTKENPVSVAANAAANAFPLMMLGLPPQIPEGLNPIQQIQTLFGLIGGYISKIEQTTKVPTQNELAGLKTVSVFIGTLVTGMQGDTANEPRFMEFSNDLRKLNAEIAKLEQLMNAEMQKSGQGSGVQAETAAKIQAIQATTAAKIQSKQQETALKLQQKELADRQKSRHKDSSFVGEQRRKDVATIAEVARTSAKASVRKPFSE